jgi:hypothetical protein
MFLKIRFCEGHPSSAQEERKSPDYRSWIEHVLWEHAFF